MKFNITIDIDEEDEDLCGKSCPFLGDKHFDRICLLFDKWLNVNHHERFERDSDCLKLTDGLL